VSVFRLYSGSLYLFLFIQRKSVSDFLYTAEVRICFCSYSGSPYLIFFIQRKSVSVFVYTAEVCIGFLFIQRKSVKFDIPESSEKINRLTKSRGDRAIVSQYSSTQAAQVSAQKYSQCRHHHGR